MKMKKLMITGCVAAMLFLVPSQKNSWLYAADFEGNEEAWLNKCSVAQESEAVSYTHLDVYKRQVYSGPECDGCSGNASGNADCLYAQAASCNCMGQGRTMDRRNNTVLYMDGK